METMDQTQSKDLEKESETIDANLDMKSRLEKLTKLHEEGILTKEEYQNKSHELIDKI